MDPTFLRLFAEIGAILSSSESKQDRAAGVLNALGVVVPYDAASISAARTGLVEHVSLANHGYPPVVERHLNNWFVRNDAVYLLMRRNGGPPLRWRDSPFRYRDTYSAQEVFIPAGYNEGITVCARNRRGVYTGSLHLSVEDKDKPTDEAVRFLDYLSTMLGELTDLGLPPPPVVAGGSTIVVTPTGARARSAARCVPDDLVRLIRALVASNSVPTWFWWRSSTGDVRLVTTERIGDEVIVHETSAELPYGLSVREFEVLTLIAGGHTNMQIANRLTISPKTVAKHVEHMLAKLGAAGRTEAAVRAVRLGLVLLSATHPLPPR